jgi:hypothetical protein
VSSQRIEYRDARDDDLIHIRGSGDMERGKEVLSKDLSSKPTMSISSDQD